MAFLHAKDDTMFMEATWFRSSRQGGVGNETDEEYIQHETGKSHLEPNFP